MFHITFIEAASQLFSNLARHTLKLQPATRQQGTKKNNPNRH